MSLFKFVVMQSVLWRVIEKTSQIGNVVDTQDIDQNSFACPEQVWEYDFSTHSVSESSTRIGAVHPRGLTSNDFLQVCCHILQQRLLVALDFMGLFCDTKLKSEQKLSKA